MLQYQQAKAEILAHFKYWFESGLTVGIPGEFGPLVLNKRGGNVPYTPKVQWEQVEPIDSYDTNEHWLRFNSQDTDTKQDAFAQDENVVLHESIGLIIVQLFFSKSSYNFSDCNKLKRICQKAFQRKRTPNGVWFKNSTIIDLSEESVFFRANVNAEYTYNSRN